jgi:hypothetical protein
MYQQPRHCFLTALQFGNNVQFENVNAPVLVYYFHPIGKAKFTLPVVIQLQNERKYKHPALAGICRNAFEMKEEPPLIDADFYNTGYKNVPYPKTFNEKCNHLLKLLYKTGGEDFKPRSLFSYVDYTVCYCEDENEFHRVVKYLKEKYLITIDHEIPLSQGRSRYNDILLTDDGIEEVQKELPKMPMIGLINQEISTGDYEIDEKINHAKQLFLQHPQTSDRMRSACETLSYVLEPMRKKLEKYFSSKDINDFFQIVNAFDIRHNKDHTKNIDYPEQLEWVFYSLLNTINTYSKLENRLNR